MLPRWPILLLAGLPLACGTGSTDLPEVIADAPGFELVDQGGRPFGDEDLRGHVWVANFVFTRCRGICPRLSARMADLQRELRSDPAWKDLRLVSFSVDPAYDRPPVLADYAERYGADPEHWIFLTGGRDEIWELSKAGFKLPVGENPGDADEPLFHSGRFVLVDRQGRIRGYYEALEEAGHAALLEAATALARAPGDRV